MDTNPRCLVTASVLSDKFVQAPPVGDPSFRDVIEDVIGRESITTYVPLLNDEFSVACEIKDKRPGLDVWATPLSAALASDKRKASSWLKSQHVVSPRTFDLSEIVPGENYFIKPVNGCGSRSAQAMVGRDLLKLPSDHFSGMLIQERCDGPEVTVDSFRDAKEDFCLAIARERLEVKSGVCTKARVYYDEAIQIYAKLIAVALNQHGLICFQLMRKGDGWAVTDLNFRPGAGTAMTVAAGWDVISAAFACRWGEEYRHFIEKKVTATDIFVTRQYAEFVTQN